MQEAADRSSNVNTPRPSWALLAPAAKRRNSLGGSPSAESSTANRARCLGPVFTFPGLHRLPGASSEGLNLALPMPFPVMPAAAFVLADERPRATEARRPGEQHRHRRAGWSRHPVAGLNLAGLHGAATFAAA